MQITAPTSFSELLLGWTCECVGKCTFVCLSLYQIQTQRLALGITERKDRISAHTLAWLLFYTKGSLWRTSCVRILAFVGMLERLLRSGDMTLGGSSSLLVLPSKHSLFLFILFYSFYTSCFLSSQPSPLLPSLLIHSPPSVWPLYCVHHRPEFVGLNTQCKAAMPQLALAAWDNYSFPIVCQVIH